MLKRLYCYYYSKRVGGRLSPRYLSWAGCDMCDTLYANKFASVCAMKSFGTLPANCWGPSKDDSDPCWKCSDQPPSKQFRKKNPRVTKQFKFVLPGTKEQPAQQPGMCCGMKCAVRLICCFWNVASKKKSAQSGSVETLQADAQPIWKSGSCAEHPQSVNFGPC